MVGIIPVARTTAALQSALAALDDAVSPAVQPPGRARGRLYRARWWMAAGLLGAALFVSWALVVATRPPAQSQAEPPAAARVEPAQP